MSCQSYAVELSETAAGQREEISEAGREEIDATLRTLEDPGKQRGVARIRSRNAPVQPLFYFRTQHFGIFHTVDEGKCVVYVLALFRRPDLTLPRR
jgi:hypothetical protein